MAKKIKHSTMKASDPNSKRSKRRLNRGSGGITNCAAWISLEKSCRKHRRAKRRSLISRTQYNVLGNPGDKMGTGSQFVHISGGSTDYHS